MFGINTHPYLESSQQGNNQPHPTSPEKPLHPTFGPPFGDLHLGDSQRPPLEDASIEEEAPLYEVMYEQMRSLHPITQQFTKGIKCILAIISLPNLHTSKPHHSHRGILVNLVPHLIGMIFDDYANDVEIILIERFESPSGYERGA